MVKIADDKTDLRRGLDHIGVTVCFIVHDGKNNILLQKRSQQCRDERGRWDIGGGAVEFGELMEDAVRREVYEEICVEPLEIEFLTAYEAHRTNEEGIPTHWIALLHVVKVEPKAVKIGEPHKIDEIGWFTSQTLPSPAHSNLNKNISTAQQAGVIR